MPKEKVIKTKYVSCIQTPWQQVLCFCSLSYVSLQLLEIQLCPRPFVSAYHLSVLVRTINNPDSLYKCSVHHERMFWEVMALSHLSILMFPSSVIFLTFSVFKVRILFSFFFSVNKTHKATSTTETESLQKSF